MTLRRKKAMETEKARAGYGRFFDRAFDSARNKGKVCRLAQAFALLKGKSALLAAVIAALRGYRALFGRAPVLSPASTA